MTPLSPIALPSLCLQDKFRIAPCLCFYHLQSSCAWVTVTASPAPLCNLPPPPSKLFSKDSHGLNCRLECVISAQNSPMASHPKNASHPPNSYTGLGDLHQCRPAPPPSVWGLCPPQECCAQVPRLLTVLEHSRQAAVPDVWSLLSAREPWPPGTHRAYSLASSPTSTFTQASPLRGGLPWPPGPKTATSALTAGHRIILLLGVLTMSLRVCLWIDLVYLSPASPRRQSHGGKDLAFVC